MNFRKPPIFVLLSALLITVFLAVSCDNTLHPFNKDKGLYSVYGYLDIDSDVNYIRIKDLNMPFVEDSTRKIDAKVRLTNERNEVSQTLTDSVVEFEGLYTHNFRTTLDINPDTKYQLTVKRSDGKVATATATTPRIADTNVDPLNADCRTPITVRFKPVLKKADLYVRIGFEYRNKKYWVNPFLQTRKDEPELIYMRFTPQDIIAKIFSDDRGRPTIACYQLSSKIFYVDYIHYGPDFNQGSSSDTLDIPGGAGKFGGLYNRRFHFPIDTTNLCRICKSIN